jgi:hypothetical protein
MAVEALAPLADDLTRRVQTGPDLIVAEAGGRQQDDRGANDVTVR